MKKFKFVLFVILLSSFTSCIVDNSDQMEVMRLESQKKSLVQDINNLDIHKRHIEEEIEEMKSGTNYSSKKYILKLKLKQTRISLDIGKHLKDAANATEIEIPVDAEFYHSVDIGTKITNEFRMGSVILYGSLSKWNVTVVGKRIH